MLTAIGIDADDTLWHAETVFAAAHEKYRALLSRWHDGATVDRVLFATEMRNLELYGYGVKAHTLSCIETAIELSGGAIRPDDIRAILATGREMLQHPVELLDGATAAVTALAASHTLLVITKGDLRDQERKLAKSGLTQYFHHVEIVAEKNPETYARILRRQNIAPGQFLMVGNSLKSDVLPVLDLGGYAALVPYHLLWEAEHTTEPPPAPGGRFHQLASLRELPALVARLDAGGAPA